MNVLELKGELLEMISSVQSEQLLLRIRDAFIQLKSEKAEYTLSAEQELTLAEALAESYEEENLISLEEAKKRHARWLPQ